MQHRKEAHELKEDLSCGHCGKQFGQRDILELHYKIHESLSGGAIVDRSGGKTDGAKQHGKSSAVMSSLTFSPGKKVGLTRVRMEDCLRCDECSCIYINEDDYHKHMKNFHRKESPRKNRPRRACWSCCKNCNCKDLLSTIQKDHGSNANLFHCNIKDRWSKISSRLQLPDLSLVKTEPKEEMVIKKEVADMEDYTHLLSQVEVKIKTEPPDEVYG